MICLIDRTVNPNLDKSFSMAISNFDLSLMGVFNSLPLIIFAYMYQTNIAMVYVELKKPKEEKLQAMRKVMVVGTVAATVLYLLAGIFGYVTFANDPDRDAIFNKQNILEVEYRNSPAIYVARFGLLVVVMVATPLSILPCKDTVEELYYGDNGKFTTKQNVIATLILVIISYVLGIVIPNIGDALTILGATTNPCIGFIFPIIFHMKIIKKEPRCGSKKVTMYIVAAFIILSSIIEIGTFIYKKVNGL